MQPRDNDQRPTQSDIDGGRNAEQRTSETQIGLALAALLNMADRKMHIAEPGKPVNMDASLSGQGGLRG